MGVVFMYDVTIIGAGIIGTSIARELSKYKLKILMLDKASDVADGTTKANSAIVHAGYDAEEGTLKARFNVLGNSMYENLCRELHVPFKRIGSFVLAFDEKEMIIVNDLYKRGLNNGVHGMTILSGEEVFKMERNLSDKVVGALYAQSAGIVGPWELAIALAENAIENGVELQLNSEVTGIVKRKYAFEICINKKKIESKMIINCAGVYADEINNMINDRSFEIIPNAGEYNLFDKSMGAFVNSVIFRCPTESGKGVLITPTVHGNMLIGPTSNYVEDKEAIETTYDGMMFINDLVKETTKDINFKNVITSFTGLRAKTSGRDFIIEESKDNKGFFNVAGIDSPGLSAAPAIAEYIVELIENSVGELERNNDFKHERRPNIHFMELSDSEKEKMIEENPLFGRVICRCENITEGEIVDVIKRKAGAVSVDGVKRRARPGSGRCQGGFCAPRVMEILARELGTDIDDIVKDGPDSIILTGRTK